MRLHILSDLHLEFAPFSPTKVGADVVILAGDTHTGKNGLKWAVKTFPGLPVIYVLGNHEFYGHSLPKLTGELTAAARGSNVSILENDSVTIGDVTFLGATLWTDFQLHHDLLRSESAAQIGMMDYKRIRLSPRFRRLCPSDTRSLNARSVSWLQSRFAALEGGKIAVVTHHAPSGLSVPERFKGDVLSPAFASNLDTLVGKSGAALWIHGHIHDCAGYQIGGTRVVANPRGYPGETLHPFDPGFVLEM